MTGSCDSWQQYKAANKASLERRKQHVIISSLEVPFQRLTHSTKVTMALASSPFFLHFVLVRHLRFYLSCIYMLAHSTQQSHSGPTDSPHETLIASSSGKSHTCSGTVPSNSLTCNTDAIPQGLSGDQLRKVC